MSRRVLQGTVISDRSDKTIIVTVKRRITHPIYKKIMVRSKKIAAHDEQNQFKIGDDVRIQECRPLSKSKRWEVIIEGQIPFTMVR